MNLHRAWSIVLAAINLYRKRGIKPDFNMIKKFAYRRVRDLYCSH